jgi:SSS family solute:Na+ symporter
VIGTATKALYPKLDSPDAAFATIVGEALPVGVKGLVLAAALSAVMSTSSGALIACATVANNDIWTRLRHTAHWTASRASGASGKTPEGAHDEIRGNRVFILIMGAAVVVIAITLNDVVKALTVAYNLLVGGLLVPILGGLLWRRGTAIGALTAVAAGGVTVVGIMVWKGILANEAIYYGLLASLLTYVVMSLVSKPTDPEVLTAWRARLTGEPQSGKRTDAPAGA